jgi:hypothetical protein
MNAADRASAARNFFMLSSKGNGMSGGYSEAYSGRALQLFDSSITVS